MIHIQRKKKKSNKRHSGNRIRETPKNLKNNGGFKVNSFSTLKPWMYTSQKVESENVSRIWHRKNNNGQIWKKKLVTDQPTCISLENALQHNVFCSKILFPLFIFLCQFKNGQKELLQRDAFTLLCRFYWGISPRGGGYTRKKNRFDDLLSG